jgi:hypothetical protein
MLHQTGSARRRHAQLLEPLEPRCLLSTYYVSPIGNDLGPGSAAQPWQTLQNAANLVGPGDAVDVRPGTYVGFNLTTSGTAAARITFSAELGVTVNQPYVGGQDAINMEGASYVTIQGFTVTPAAGVTIRAGIRSVTNTNVQILGNTVLGVSWWGILTGFSQNVDIENNTTAYTQIQHGIYVGNSADNPIIRHNYTHDNRQCGIQINADASQGGDGIITNAMVDGNLIANNCTGGGAGINFDGVQNSTIQNNLILNNIRNGIALYQTDGADAAKNNTIQYNTIVQNQGYYAVDIIGGAVLSSTGNQVLHNTLISLRGSELVSADSRPGFISDYNIVNNKFNLAWDESQPTDFPGWQTATGQDLHSTQMTDPSTLSINPDAFLRSIMPGTGATDPGVGQLGGAGAPQIGLVNWAMALPPSPPVLSSAKTVSPARISLAWSDPTADASEFNIWQINPDGTRTDVGTAGPAARSFTVAGLANNTRYTFAVTAANAAGDSVSSKMLTVRTDPRRTPIAPANLIAEPLSSNDVELTWQDRSDNETAFIVLRRTIVNPNYTAIATLPANTICYSDTYASAGASYYYRVIAVNGRIASAQSNRVMITVPTAAPAPAPVIIALPPAPVPPSTDPTSTLITSTDSDLLSAG